MEQFSQPHAEGRFNQGRANKFSARPEITDEVLPHLENLIKRTKLAGLKRNIALLTLMRP
jgi:hypothetical protein